MQYNKEDFMQYVQQRIGDLHQYEYDETMQKVASLHDFAVKLVEQDQMEKRAFRTWLRASMPAFTTVGRANKQVAQQALAKAKAQGGAGISRYRAAQNAYDKYKFNNKTDAANYLVNRNTGNPMVDSGIARTTNKYLNSYGYGENINNVQQKFLNDVRSIRARARQTQVGTPEWNKLQQELNELTAQGQNLSNTYGVKFDTGMAQKRMNDFARGRTEQAIVGERQALNDARAQRNYNQQETLNRQQFEQQEAANQAAAQKQMNEYNQGLASTQKAIEDQRLLFQNLYSNGINISNLKNQGYLNTLNDYQRGLVGKYTQNMEDLIKRTNGKVTWDSFTQKNVMDQNLSEQLMKQHGFTPRDISHYYTPGTYTPSPAPTPAGQPITRGNMANTAGAAEAGAAEAGAAGAPGWGQYALPAGIGLGAGLMPAMMGGGGGGKNNEALQMQNAMLMQQLMQVRQNNDSFGNRLLNLFNSDTIFNR